MAIQAIHRHSTFVHSNICQLSFQWARMRAVLCEKTSKSLISSFVRTLLTKFGIASRYPSPEGAWWSDLELPANINKSPANSSWMTDSGEYDKDVIGTGRTMPWMEAWKFCHGIRRAKAFKAFTASGDFCQLLIR